MQKLAGILALLLFLCLAHPCTGEAGREIVVVFKGGQTQVPFEDNNKQVLIKKPLAFRVPAFVGGVFNNKEFLAVLCDARYNGFSDWSFIDAAAKTSYGDYKIWSDAEIFAKNSRKNLTHSVVGDLTAVMKGDKIFVLAPSWDASPNSWVHHNGNTGWNPLMIVGTVVFSDESKDGGASITWEAGKSLKSLLPTTVNGGQGSQFIGGVGNGVVMKNGTIVFPIQIANSIKKVSSSIMYSTDDGNTWIMGKPTPNGPSECSVVEWGEGKLLLTTRYDSGYRIVYESDDMGKTWKESLMFSQIWGNQPDRRDVGSQGTAITAPVDDKDVLLFSHPLNKKGRYARDTLQLWMSDGQRIMCVGTISEKGKGESSGYSILALVGDNLYSLHEINPYGSWNNYNAPLKRWDRVIALSPLSHFYENIKNTVRAWREMDIGLQTKGISTEGLVGYLGSSNSDTVWEDMYKCVNANVNGATRTQNGFRFNNVLASGAQWPVSSQGQNQVYIFTKKQFTLAATVTIHSTSGAEDVSLLGASARAYVNRVVLGLGYTQNRKWYAMKNNGNKIQTDVSLVLEKEHHVAITFANGKTAVYVDGTDITGGKLTLSSTLSISHFFIGGMGKSSGVKGGSCTVKDVMLFNRALSQEEITGLTNINKEDKQSEPTSTAEPAIPFSPAKGESVPTIETTSAPANLESDLTTETTSAPASHETYSTIESTKTMENRRAVSTADPKEVSSTLWRKVTNGEGSDKKMNNSLHEHGDVFFKKYAEGDNGTVMSFAAVAWMCIVCLFLVLTEF